MSDALKWLALGYSVPISPSKNRVYVWRKLKEFGAEYFKQGVAVLPYSKSSFSKFSHLAEKIKEMGGEASIIELKFTDPNDELFFVQKFQMQEIQEFNQLKNDCFDVISKISKQTSAAFSEFENDEIKKLLRRYSKAKQRNHFCSNLNEDIEIALRSLLEILYKKTDFTAVQLLKSIEKVLK